VRNDLHDVPRVKHFFTKAALANPSPCITAHGARLVVGFSGTADSVIFVLLGNRIVVGDIGFDLFRAADVDGFDAEYAKSVCDPLAFVGAANFNAGEFGPNAPAFTSPSFVNRPTITASFFTSGLGFGGAGWD
jgi:hypothetical protein